MVESIRSDRLSHRLCHHFLFFVSIACAEKHRRISDTFLGSLVLLDQLFQHPHVADALMRAFSYEIVNLRRPILPIAVDAAVSLLEPQKRPWEVKMNQTVALEMQIESFGGHIRGKKDANWRVFLPEVFQNLLSLLISLNTSAVDPSDGIFREVEVTGQSIG